MVRHFFFAGHLRRFMRGIAELMEVMKSGPPTPSPISLQTSISAKLNSVAPPLTAPRGDGEQNKNGEFVSSPASFDEVTTPTDTDRIYRDESQLVQVAANKPHPPQESQTVHNHDIGMGSSNFSKMRSLLALQLAGGSIDLEDGEDASPTQSPPHSPVVSHKEVVGAPLPPRRGPQTHAAGNRHSYSSSTSSLSSNQSDVRVSGSHDFRSSVEVPLATQLNQQAASPLVTNRSKCISLP